MSLQSAGAAGDRGWQALALDDQGVAHVQWLDHRGLATAKGEHQHKGEHDGVAMAQMSGLYYATLGARASADREITPGVCYCCKSAIVALPGGRLVSAWRHVYADNMRDIAFTESRDGGRTFAAPARVSEDGWSINGCPDDGPALAADAAGGVHIAWPTVIPGDEPQGALFYAPMQPSGGFAAARARADAGQPEAVASAGGRGRGRPAVRRLGRGARRRSHRRVHRRLARRGRHRAVRRADSVWPPTDRRSIR